MDLDHFFFLQSKSGKMRSPGKVKGEAAKAEEEFEVEEVKDRIEGSLGSRLALVTRELGLNTAAAAARRFSGERIVGEISGCCRGYIIQPDKKYAISPLSFPLPNFHHFVSIRFCSQVRAVHRINNLFLRVK